jgi:hypothetical protein
MDKEYLHILKSVDMRPKKPKIKEGKEEVLLEKIEKKIEVLKELFIQAGEIEKMEAGAEKDKAILRLSIVAELDAVNLYQRFADIASSEDIRDVMIHVADEEKVHVGEFQSLLEDIDENYEDKLEEGEEEVEEELEGDEDED